MISEEQNRTDWKLDEASLNKWEAKQAEIAKLCGVSNQDNAFKPMWCRLNLENEDMSTCLYSPATQEYTEQEILAQSPRVAKNSEAGDISHKFHERQREHELPA